MFKKILTCFIFIFTCSCAFALDASVPLKVWVNEAIINTYTFNDANLLERQKDMAQYFTPQAWKVYLDVLNKSNILTQVQSQHYEVSAVATLPPSITENPSTHSWQAQMPILVSYKNKEQKQTQNLEIQLEIIKSDSSNNRGYAIIKYEAKILNHPCTCQAQYPKVTIV